ncbi:MAG: DNA-(Apurinic or apyrimidinic site) lyase [Candidatus Woesebacteria bacterium GW2011_GWA1_34_41]|uniref:DNA-(Apurinic or apyrimidinic site) lyase n=1 Tax=Candidatus Woesebacteria bacterium GW2011_GWC2_31_9 TaxID=1618586 RepID=A0A0F9Z0D7_9BACT|nr:MAG: DNA-(Apurinic or apyrimidinic site) lyase [Candidatus Woesebacteria bacterium GW2011_GWD1_31_12]KKP32136.1 MAG: DNA-(Apurinic or apyrimidinic site) lyase [Candidatus Woesebacteria bacterium GW2011_GWC2_31_9]KKP34324.1 MAG: DNA-(Apurinic or apyrimidinic site) lyase [Candidatus Woesebacteria bacterium GW2011_GWF2_32_16]KKP62427.1 MAG: DNA-(Apurinic or apyrimidinic site) lyase [Candidatus Woesebacteria bacterium GW2011_GWA1_34_41]KKP73358.1 MAG: DNA-(Apurinic or apyrimidinic site) lyase [C
MVKKLQKLFVKFVEQQCSRSVEINFEQVFKTFRRNYKLVPLEVFGDNPYKTLISTILSSRTKDEVTLKASKRLFKIAPTLKELSKLKESQIKKLIYPVGFYKTKARHLIKLAKMINKIPNTKEGLIKLPGVGIKTANLTLNRAFNVPAISVDTHVHKITNLLGWVKTKTPDQTEKELNKILPKKYWKDINRYFVSIGRQYTTKKKLIKFFNSQGLL